MKKQILVTGGAGFLGSHLVKRLLRDGARVYCLDNLYTGSEENIKDLLKNSEFTFIKHDVEEPIEFDVQEIYNLACPASPIHYQRDRVKTTTTCFNGTLRMLELAKKTGARILLTSTSEVYGDPPYSPQSEQYFGNVNPNGIRSCYDEGKRVAESLMVSFYDQHATDIRIARIFNTYGPQMDKDDGRVVSNFICQALNDSEITIYGDGRQTRSFCYVSDMVEALVRLMGSSSYTGPTNLGNPEERPIISIANIIKDMTGSRSKIVFHPLPKDDPKQRCPYIAKAKRELNWEPKIDFVEGVGETIAYFRGLFGLR